MRTIETTATISDDGTLIAHGVDGVAPGEHRIVVLIDDAPATEDLRPPLSFARYPAGFVDPTFTVRREDIYDDGP